MKILINKGFTIIEFLIYITILAIVTTIIGAVAGNVLQVGARINTIQEVNQNGIFAMQRIGEEIRFASAIVLPETQSNSLILEFEDIEKTPTIFDVHEKTLRVKRGNREYIDLTTPKVNVDKITFKKIFSSGADSIKIEMDISFNNPEKFPEYSFNNFFTGSFTIKK